MKNLCFLFLFLFLSFGCKKKIESEKKHTSARDYFEHQFKSPIMEETRTIKVFLPEGYNPEKKYPIIYTLDGDWMFEIVSTYTKYLIDYNDEKNIPPSIVVGIFHTNRFEETKPNFGFNGTTPINQLLPNTLQFKEHLFDEIIPFINSNYSSSGYNILIGHSNTASLAMMLLLEQTNPFRGFIALSPGLMNEQISLISKELNKTVQKLSVFIGSGLKDDPFRIETGRKLDSIINLNTERVYGKHLIANAGHNDLVVKTLLSGIESMFLTYLNFDDFKEKVIKNKGSIANYFKSKQEETKQLYGVSLNIPDDGYFAMEEMIIDDGNEVLLDDFFSYVDENFRAFPSNKEAYSFRAQAYEAVGAYEKALQFWKLQIDKGYRENIFYFRRQMELLVSQLNRPTEAFSLLEKGQTQYPKGILFFNFHMARLSAEYKIKLEKGKIALQYCEQNFEENKWFQKEELEQLKKHIINQ